MIKRLKEAVGIGTPDNYASKAMTWLGNTLILDRTKFGLNDEFWWDQEDRTPLRGAEVYDPAMQRLYYATDDFRRKLTSDVARFFKFPVLVISTGLILGGFAMSAIFGPSIPAGFGDLNQGAANGEISAGPEAMTNEALLAAMKKMEADGKTKATLTTNDRAILRESERRGLYY